MIKVLTPSVPAISGLKEGLLAEACTMGGYHYLSGSLY
jgi:hypothetical protein